MTVSEFYDAIGADYRSALARFAGSEALLNKFLLKFKDDPTYAKLEEAYDAKDYDAILAHAHTLKGVCGNLNLDCLTAPATQIVAMIRAGEQEQIGDEYAKAQAAYALIMDNLKQC